LIQFGQRLFQHLAMTRALDYCKLLDNSLAGQLQNLSLPLAGRFFRAQPGTGRGGFLARVCLLRLNRFAFPAAGHLIIIAGALQKQAATTAKKILRSVFLSL
jgi:hypothetical protein